MSTRKLEDLRMWWWMTMMMMVTMVGTVTAQNGKKIELHRQILEDFKLRGVVGWWGGCGRQ